MIATQVEACYANASTAQVLVAPFPLLIFLNTQVEACYANASTAQTFSTEVPRISCH